MEQAIQGAGTLPLASVSISADAWVDGANATVMPASATSVMAGGGEWARLGGEAVDLPAGGVSQFAVMLRLDVPQGALPAGAAPVEATQSVIYTVACEAPPG